MTRQQHPSFFRRVAADLGQRARGSRIEEQQAAVSCNRAQDPQAVVRHARAELRRATQHWVRSSQLEGTARELECHLVFAGSLLAPIELAGAKCRFGLRIRDVVPLSLKSAEVAELLASPFTHRAAEFAFVIARNTVESLRWCKRSPRARFPTWSWFCSANRKRLAGTPEADLPRVLVLPGMVCPSKS